MRKSLQLRWAWHSRQLAPSMAVRFKAICVIAIFLTVPSLVFARATVFIQPLEIESPAVGEEFSVAVDINDGKNVSAYQVTVEFSPQTLALVDSKNADYLPAGAFVVPPLITDSRITVAATSLAGASNGDGTLATITFAVVEVSSSTIGFTAALLSDPDANQLDLVTTNGRIIGLEVKNEFPIAIIDAAPARVLTGQAVSLSGMGSIDDGGIRHYAWHFGDGSSVEGQEMVEHIYRQPGNYTVTLTVTDDGVPALTDRAILVITVTDKNLSVRQQRKKITLWGQFKIKK